MTEREILIRRVADLFHTDGNGLPWLIGTVLQHGKYRCLSELPIEHMKAILAAT